MASSTTTAATSEAAAEKKKFTLKASDGEILEVEPSAIIKSETIKHLIDYGCAVDEIPLQNVTGPPSQHIEESAGEIILNMDVYCPPRQQPQIPPPDSSSTTTTTTRRLNFGSFSLKIKPPKASESILPSYHIQNSPPNANQTHHDQHTILHSITAHFRDQELGRHIMVLTVPITAATFYIYKEDLSSLMVSLILLCLSIGFAATWNGILLRGMYPRASNVTEQIGVTFILLALFGMLGCLLPATFYWVPGLSFVVSLLPLVISICSKKKSTG